jgi:LysM repeat protein
MPNNLNDLQTYLQGQATQTGGVVLDSTFLPQRALDLMAQQLLLSSESIALTSVDPAKITLSNDGTTLFVSAAQTPDDADDTFLSLTSMIADVAITQTTPNDPTGFDLILRVTLSSDWTFGQSFEQLVLSEFDDSDYVKFDGTRYLLFSTYTSAQPLPAFPGGPAGNSNPILQTGLNFYATLTLAGLFGQILNIIKVNPGSFTCYGVITQTSDGPTFDLHTPLTASGPLSIGFITIQAPWAGLMAGYYKFPPDNEPSDSDGDDDVRALALAATDDSSTVLQSMLYLGVEVDIGQSLPLDIRAGLLDGAKSVVLSVSSGPNQQPITLAQLAAVLMNSSPGDLQSKLPSDLYALLDDIGIKTFNAGFTVQPSPGMSFVHVVVGTITPWKLGIRDFAISLSFDWLIQFVSGTHYYLSFEGIFYPNANDQSLSFLVRVDVADGTITSITGQENGRVNLSLSNLAKALDADLQIPPDLLQLGLENFAVTIDRPNKHYTITGTLYASFNLFGTQILGIDAAAINVDVDASGENNVYAVSLDGLLSLGPITTAVSATLGTDQDTVLSVHLVNETVGSMLNHLVHLVDPTYDISFGDPWDKLLDISLDSLVLTITLPKDATQPRLIELSYGLNLDLEFITLSAIKLDYTKPQTGAGSVKIGLDGSFLGQSFGGNSGNPPLQWDAINDNPPSIPGKGPTLFDLQYAGLGQHVALQGPDLTTVEKVMAALRNSVIPIQDGQLPPFGQQGGISFSADSNWLIGAQFTVMDTVAISAIFNDPNLYGILIGLSGEKAKIFAGLSFEILYRKVTDSIGVYHIELKLPDAMRHLEFGEVSITLPILILDIYTNGNFRVDLGYPVGLDFSNSFSIQVFPFVGFGGFYFALLDGSTSSRVPVITNGSFSPVIEFGIALSLGVGKEVDEGILKGGISVTVIGILQGVLGWFHPTDNAPKDTYYWIQGTVAVVGKLYATIDFVIIQASVDVTAYLSVSLTIECYEPIYIEATASVSVRVSVKIVFFTIHFSFSATVDASFTIGHASTTPWVIAPNGGSSSAVRRLLRGQATLHSRAPRHARSRKALRRALLAAPPPLTNWPAVCVLPQGAQTIRIWAMPTFTKSETNPSAANAVVLLAAENSVHPAASTPAEHRLLHGAAPAEAPFNLLMEAMLRWGIYAETNNASTVTADQLETLRQQLKDNATLDAAFDYTTLTNFLAKNFTFQVMPAAQQAAASIAAPPTGAMRANASGDVNDMVTTITTTAPHGLAAGDSVVISGVTDQSFCGQFDVATVPSATTFSYRQPGLPAATSGNGMANKATGVAVFPMIPEIVLTDTTGTDVPFSTFNSVDTAYQEKVRAYFQLLQVQFQARSNGGAAPPQARLAAGEVSIATVVFSRYFNMLMAAGVKAAIDLLAHYPYTTASAMGIADIGQALNDPTLADNPLRIVTPNQDSDVLNPGALFTFPDVVHQVRLNESFASIASALAGAGACNAASSAPIASATPPAPGVPGAVRHGGVTTISTVGPHGLVLNSSAVVSGVADNSFNGTFVVADVPNASTFSYAQAGQPDATSGAGTASTAGATTTYSTLDLIGANLDSTGILNTGTATWPISGTAGAVRQNGTNNATTTITTTVPHGLVPGSTVTVSGVPDTSFNGTFVVASVPSATSFTYAQPGLSAGSSSGGSAAAVIALQVGGITYTTQANDTLGLIATRLLLRAAGPAVLGSITGLAQAAQALLPLNPSITDANTLIDPLLVYPPVGAVPTVTLVGGGSYSVVTGDTLTLVAAYPLAIAQSTVSTSALLAAIHQLNPALTTDPTQVLPAGTSITLPPVTRALNAADTIDSLATTLITSSRIIQNTVVAVPSGLPVLAPQAVLKAPLRYPVQGGDKLSGIAGKFNLSLTDVGGEAASVAGLFAADRTVIVSDLPSIAVDGLIAGLLNQTEWNNASGMVSRFLLSGLRLPDPHDQTFQHLSLADLQNPVNLGGIQTAPLFGLTGQQYAFPGTAPQGYQITLTNGSGAPWLSFSSGGSNLSFALTADQLDLLGKIVAGRIAALQQQPVRMSLFQMVPPRTALQDHIAWQAATLPAGTLSSSGAATGHPSIWLFPDALVLQIEATTQQPTPALYELVAAKHHDPGQAMTADQVASYAWATIIDIDISLPQTDGDAPSVANCYVINGADDTGAALLQEVYQYLSNNSGDTPTLYLLYSPSPTGGNPSGLSSDQADVDATCLIKSNLSTLTHSSAALLAGFVAPDPTNTFACTMGDASSFTALLWEASITRSGGFYLNYVNQNGGNGFPATVFGNQTRATVSLLVVLGSQAKNPDAPMQPFNNCVIVGDNIDTGTTTLFVQPAVYAVQPGDSLTTAQTAINASWDTNFTVLEVATFNATVPLLLAVGEPLGIPGQADYQIQYGDTLASIVANPQLHLQNLAALLDATNSHGQANSAAPILASGAQMQFAQGVLRPVTTVPPGTTGFELARANPDPDGVPYTQLDANALVSELFNLVGFSIEGGKGGFLASGAGLPTTPADSLQKGSDGLHVRQTSNATTATWYYAQTLAIGPFGQSIGDVDLALPLPEWNPYNGIAANPAATNNVTIDLCLQDIYGNRQPLPSSAQNITIPVGYYDDVVSLGSWPSLAMSYAVSGTPPAAPVISFNMTMQQVRYVPSPSLTVAAALSAIAADLGSYTRIYYQLVQPDLSFALRTSLDAASMTAPQPTYSLARTPFLSFAYGAYIYLAALSALQRVQFTVSDNQTHLDAISGRYGVTAAELFTENSNQLYDALFGATLNVPQMYSCIHGDSLTSIVTKWASYQLTPAQLAQLNDDVPLAAGTDFAAPQRSFATAVPIAAPATGAVRSAGIATILTTAPHGFAAGDTVTVAGVTDASFNGAFAVASVPDATHFTYAQQGAADATSGNGTVAGPGTLNAIAARAHAAVGALALANATRADILRANVFVTVGTQSYQIKQNDSLTAAAAALGVSIDVLGEANQWLRGLLIPGVTLGVDDVVAGSSDTLTTVAAVAGQSLADFVAYSGNESVQDLFATGTAITIGTAQNPKPPVPGDTLASFAQSNAVTLDALAGANPSALLRNAAVIDIPATVQNPAASGYCTYSAQSSDKLAGIAQKFGTQPAAVATLNSDIPGLLAGGQTITDSTSGQSVQTEANDSFDGVIARFAAIHHVTVTLAQLAGDVANQNGLLLQGGLWICPAMRGDAYGLNTNLSLGSLAQIYNADLATLALANSAVIGFLAAGQTVVLGGATITTNDCDTLNSLVNRAATAGVTMVLADVITAVAGVAKLIAPNALVLPVPPPSPAGNAVAVKPNFSNQVFQIVVNVVASRNPHWIDPDFVSSTSVATSTYGVPPEPDPAQTSQATFSLTHFAKAFQAAVPGLQIATGAAVAEGDPASAGTIWGVNFNQNLGPYISYQFSGSDTVYFALPPLSTALMSGSVPIRKYVSGQGFVGDAQNQTFQAVDLDVWLNTFLGAVDLFLSPALAVPAYAVDATDTVQIIEDKRRIAGALKERLQLVLQNQQGQGSLAEAKEALYQAMLQTLSSAFTVDTIVQVPVAVTSTLPDGKKLTDPKSAPRLSGKIVMNGQQTELPNAFSFSTAKVSLTDSTAPAPTPTANFLFSVKAPAQHKDVQLNLQYIANELELPDPNEVIGDYEGSSWLKFVLPLDPANSTIGNVDIPVPLRAYPSPVTLVSQTAQQGTQSPKNADDLLPWNFKFVYQHDDAEQDTPLVVFSFNAPVSPQESLFAASTYDVNKVFAALAKFISAYGTLKDDLAALAQVAPGTAATNPNPTISAAVSTFAFLVHQVADAWQPRADALAFSPPQETYRYQMQKDADSQNELTALTITSLDENGEPVEIAPALWPYAYALDSGTFVELTAERPDVPAQQLIYDYPSGIKADQPLAQYFVFAEQEPTQPPQPPTAGNVQQTFEFRNPDIFTWQTAHSAVSISRNLSLVSSPTNTAFVYCTPLTNFPSIAMASVLATDTIALAAAQNAGQALGEFFQELLSHNQWQKTDTLTIRFAASYSFDLATSHAAGSKLSSLDAGVPILLVPTYDFNPSSDGDWTNPASFVAQIENALDAWTTQHAPLPPHGSYLFDLTIYAAQGESRPLIRAQSLQYALQA